MNSIINKNIKVIDLGLIPFKDAWDYQESLLKNTVSIKITNRNNGSDSAASTQNYLIFCQHPHVYTLGKSGKKSNLLIDEGQLIERSIEYFEINRGGDITYHGPGQLVCYPILDLENFFTDIHKYLRALEQAVIDTLSEFKINGERYEGLTGVWIKTHQKYLEKICAIGVKTSRWVTMHGLALNINTDLEYFENIIPCGIDDKAVTSMKKLLSSEFDFGMVQKKLLYHIADQFGMTIQK